MRVIVTCGPSWEPIDQVRRLTNFSTGELGLMLSAALARDGNEVLCLKGDGASSALPAPDAEIVPFSTNDDLLRKLAIRTGWPDAVFHAAALCDFKVKDVPGAQPARKIPTGAGEIALTLEPAEKVLPLLREFFPDARITGWKYELDGSRADVLAKAMRQIADCGTDACVVNGAAWGAGFGLVAPPEEVVEVPDKPALCALLAQWLRKP